MLCLTPPPVSDRFRSLPFALHVSHGLDEFARVTLLAAAVDGRLVAALRQHAFSDAGDDVFEPHQKEEGDVTLQHFPQGTLRCPDSPAGARDAGLVLVFPSRF